MGHPIHKHMHTHITKSNVKAAIRDDKAHMDYLKRDIKDDQKFHVADKDAKQTADEKHITNLAQDVKHDEKKEGISRYSSGDEGSAVMMHAMGIQAARERDDAKIAQQRFDLNNYIPELDHGSVSGKKK